MIGAREYSIELLLVLILGGAVAYFGYLGYGLAVSDPGATPFSGAQAMLYVEEQMNLGYRVAGTEAADAFQELVVPKLTSNFWNVVIQPFVLSEGKQGRNIIATNRKEVDGTPVVIVGTHYDSRIFADFDSEPENRLLPAPGANSGASGPAILLELARTLKLEEIDYGICLIFFDASDNAGIQGWEAAEGSTHFVESLGTQEELARCATPQAAVIIDMVGSSDQLSYERGSNLAVVDTLRQAAVTADEIGWISEEPGPLYNGDHIPFLKISVPAVYLWDSAYPHRGTVADTAAALDAENLQRTGVVLKKWLEEGGLGYDPR